MPYLEFGGGAFALHDYIVEKFGVGNRPTRLPRLGTAMLSQLFGHAYGVKRSISVKKTV